MSAPARPFTPPPTNRPALPRPALHVVQPPADVAALPLYRLSLEQYHRIAEHGILQSEDHVELLYGLLVSKMTTHPPHVTATLLTRECLAAMLPLDLYLRTQDPITLADSEPEPDVAVARGDVRLHARRHPGPAEVPLLVEVAESSLPIDQGEKLALYASVRIAVYWIVNLIGRSIEVYSAPDGATYTSAAAYLSGEVPVVIDGREVGRVPVNDLLP